ncbi:MMPL family transporter [Klugiella xanthotipulae]|uniref:RND superfamily putative drug exporter n=1 Tax=Klugiella xanthotipulae TaxID=244735 RepID=A0A543I6I7_9MICO|nr:MMPL family transporter [Klugiella xanthotipulae]TQM66175.1 RND superfamily putative drug exporter [Klugiella xanthotipulae]
MSSLLYSLGRWAYRSRRLVLILWISILALVGGGALLFNQGTDNSFSIPGTESQQALTSLKHTFPQVSGTSAQIVVVAPNGEKVTDADIRNAIDSAVTTLAEVPKVTTVASPFNEKITGGVSDDQTAAVISIQISGSRSDNTTATKAGLTAEREALGEALPHATVSLGGELYSQTLPTISLVELVGVVIALGVLLLTLGAFAAAGMPLLNALLGVAISIALIFFSTVFSSISSTTPMLALMLGLAVGIDYALFVISRHQEQLRDGLAPEESAARAVATAGSAVIFAGLTVIIALLGLAVANIPFLTTMGFAAAAAVAISVLISITLTPALLGFAGMKILPPKQRRRTSGRTAPATPNAAASDDTNPGAPPTDTARDLTPVTDAAETGTTTTSPASGTKPPIVPHGFFGGWVRTVTRHPLVTIITVVVALGLASVPALDLRLALPDAGSLPQDNQARITYDLLSENFGEGFNGPLIVTGSIVSSTDPVGLMNDLADEIRHLDGVAAVPLATPNASADTGIVQVIPKGGPDSEVTKALVQEIRDLRGHFQDTYGIDISVTGFTAVGIDVSDRLGGALLPFGLLVVGLSLILLTMVFRSIAVPIKATLGYLLSVGASFGAVAAVFEWGWFSDALHVANIGPVISFMPIILMGVLFGLAMDYEVFLVSRIREEYVHGGNAREAIKRGFLGSSRVVTAAAIIMFAVFAAFVPEGDTSIKPIALGLAVGVFVDAFIVRMTLVPAVLALLGDTAWWMPRWLDRILPSFDVEGEGLHHELALTNWPAPGTDNAISAEHLSLTLDGDAARETSEDPVTADHAATADTFFGEVMLTVPHNGIQLITGASPEARTALLLALAGRLPEVNGQLKVLGKVLPQRGGYVRRRTAVLLARSSRQLLRDLRDTLADKPRILFIDGFDTLLDDTQPDVLHAVLQGARRDAAVGRRPLTLVVSAADIEGAHDALLSISDGDSGAPRTLLLSTTRTQLEKVL